MPLHTCAKPGVGATLVGPATHLGHVLRKCPCNAVNALALRHGVEPPPVVRRWLYALEYIDAAIFAAPWESHRVDPTDDAAWLARWPPGKRKAIVESRERDPIEPSVLSVMIKRESGHAPPTKARLIQFYTNLHTQALFGAAFVALQKSLFEWTPTVSIRGCRITYGSGMNPGQLGIWMAEVHERFATPWFYERDGKNWDATMQREHHDLKQRLYGAYDQGLSEFVEAGFKCRAVCAFPDTVFKYTINGTVKSGHNDTTLGNSIVNACIALEACCALGIEAEILVVGDDLVVACGREPVGLQNIEAEFGIKPEARVFDDYLHVSFISGVWVRQEEGFAFVPKLGRLFARLWWTVNPPPKRAHDDYVHSVVSGLRAGVGTLPLYDDFLPQTRGKIIPLGRDFDYWIASYAPGRDDYVAAGELMRRYGFSPSEFAQLRRELRELPFRPVIVRNDLMDRVCEYDLADLLERPIY